MEKLETLASRVKWARERLQLSQAALAKRAGCSQGMIGNLETGARDKPRDPFRLADALEVSAQWLYENKGPIELDRSPSTAPTKPATDGEELLRLAAEMLETYRLAGPNDRRRIDLVFREVGARIAAEDKSKSSGHG